MIPQLEWREPLWLLLLLVPWLWMAWKKRDAAAQRRKLSAFADAHLLPKLMTGQPSAGAAARRNWPFAAAWLLAALAASGPYLVQPAPQSEQRSGIDIAVVIDISPSMASPDITPSRLERAKLELRDFVQRLHGDRMALVAFSANAYVTLPLTPDKDAFLYFADLLDPALVMRHGSNLPRALHVARQTLQGSQSPGRAVLLISDGEMHNARPVQSEITRLRAAGIPLFVLGAGTEKGGPVPDGRGHFMQSAEGMVISRLARPQLESLAAATGGLYSDLRNDDSDWEKLFAGLRKIEANSYASVERARHSHQLFPWLLAASLLLFVWVGARRTEVLVMTLAVPLLALPHDSHASPWQEQRALEAFTQGDHQRAAALYRDIGNYNGLTGLGASVYRQRRWTEALTAFEQAARLAATDEQRAKAAYNRGNTLAQLGRLDEAASSYEQALRLQNNYPRAAYNLTLVKKEKALRMLAQSRKEQEQKKTALILSAQDKTKMMNTPDTPSRAGSTKTETRQKMSSLKENAQTLLSNRFSAADKAPGILVVEDEKPW